MPNVKKPKRLNDKNEFLFKDARTGQLLLKRPSRIPGGKTVYWRFCAGCGTPCRDNSELKRHLRREERCPRSDAEVLKQKAKAAEAAKKRKDGSFSFAPRIQPPAPSPFLEAYRNPEKYAWKFGDSWQQFIKGEQLELKTVEGFKDNRGVKRGS